MCPTGGLSCTFCSEKKLTKKFFFIEKVAVEIRNDYAKHPYQHSMYFKLYPLLRWAEHYVPKKITGSSSMSVKIVKKDGSGTYNLF